MTTRVQIKNMETSHSKVQITFEVLVDGKWVPSPSVVQDLWAGSQGDHTIWTQRRLIVSEVAE